MKKEDERVYTTNCRIFDRPAAAMEVSKCHSFEFTYWVSQKVLVRSHSKRRILHFRKISQLNFFLTIKDENFRMWKWANRVQVHGKTRVAVYGNQQNECTFFMNIYIYLPLQVSRCFTFILLRFDILRTFFFFFLKG